MSPESIFKNNPIQVRVTPKASSNQIKVEQMPDNSERVRTYVTCVAEGGKANEQVLKLLAKHLGVPKSSLSITKGHYSRDKVILISPK